MVLERMGGGIGRVVESLRSISRELIRADLRGPGVWSEDSRTAVEEPEDKLDHIFYSSCF